MLQRFGGPVKNVLGEFVSSTCSVISVRSLESVVALACTACIIHTRAKFKKNQVTQQKTYIEIEVDLKQKLFTTWSYFKETNDSKFEFKICCRRTLQDAAASETDRKATKTKQIQKTIQTVTKNDQSNIH